MLEWSPEKDLITLTRYDLEGEIVTRITQLSKPGSLGMLLELEFDGSLVRVETAQKEQGGKLEVFPLVFQGDWQGELGKIRARLKAKLKRGEILYPNLVDGIRILSGILVNPYQYVDSTELARGFLEGLFG